MQPVPTATWWYGTGCMSPFGVESVTVISFLSVERIGISVIRGRRKELQRD
jgi:hypothetical protein